MYPPLSHPCLPACLRACVSGSVRVCSAGAGGDEAGIWAGDLLRMYQRYASSQSWKASMISCVEADAGGYKEVVLQVRGWGREAGGEGDPGGGVVVVVVVDGSVAPWRCEQQQFVCCCL